MPHLRTHLESLQEGWQILRSNLPLTVYAVLSVVFLYLIFTDRSYFSNHIGSEMDTLFLFIIFISTAVSILLGAFLDKKISPKSHIFWNLLGFIFSLTLLIPISSSYSLYLYAIFGGLSGGFCVPNTLKLVLNLTKFENRGSASGFFTFFVYIIIFSSSFAFSTIISSAHFLIGTKLITLLISYFKPIKTKLSSDTLLVRHNLRTKVFFMLVWVIFSLVDTIISKVVSNVLVGQQEVLITIGLESVALGLIAMIIGGSLMDNFGRRRLMIFAYTYLGLEYAMVSLTGIALIGLTFLDGIAWGILTTLFLLVIWGDLESEKRPIFIAISFTIAMASYLVKGILYTVSWNVDINNTFPLTSLFLFVAVIITLFLPETLPDKVVQAKELKDYIEHAKKIREKFD